MQSEPVCAKDSGRTGTYDNRTRTAHIFHWQLITLSIDQDTEILNRIMHVRRHRVRDFDTPMLACVDAALEDTVGNVSSETLPQGRFEFLDGVLIWEGNLYLHGNIKRCCAKL